ncbi:hypothetical protein BT63DRAFT_202494 [Microthyrium microscopicum]|uniref:Zn(2)-C6 fungal-type domain-containing protein n=1 Tax=Microthyrium microscopicum TaxID=703497 RepID=A0A6A6UEW5_9PEZI|nr:hypothetical protein BT63DRAFT_202494 [Microthyrium microscopicum]
MHQSKKLVSCMPCAKRKVRCDRLQPCSHCKRRKQETCKYPDSEGVKDQRIRDQAVRIKKLEEYVRHLGGGPNDLDARAPLDTTQAGTSPALESNPGGVFVTTERGPALVRRTQLPSQTTSKIVENDDDVSYIETPMWHSWRGHDDDKNLDRRDALSSKTHYQRTILDPIQQAELDDSFASLSTDEHIHILWPVFLKNAHPLIKIFFDWEIESVIQKTQKQSSSLSMSEQSLLFGISLIAVLTLSCEQCRDMLSEEKPRLQTQLQQCLERSLLLSRYAETTDRYVLQAFMFYLLAIRNRARPAAIYSLLGIACRIAERMGLHRDGTVFGLFPVRTEERRRMWWQLQYMDIAIARLVGNVSLTVFASSWDTKIPSNLEDSDLSSDMVAMPAERKGLTDMSPCLWRYSIIQMNREAPAKDGFEKLTWPLSPQVPLEEKEAKINSIEKMLAERFLQHCEPINPLHVHIQIGIRQFVLAARSSARQPSLSNAKISEMTIERRNEMLEICSKSLEYFVMSQTTPSLLGFRWSNDVHFQVACFVYVVLEAHQRSHEETVADLWDIIGRVYEVHPDLLTAVDQPEVRFIARITIAAWRNNDFRLHRTQKTVNSPLIDGTPDWIRKLYLNFDMPLPDEVEQPLINDIAQQLPIGFDFDMVDWSAWESLL